jgi:hypothetical protein
MHNFLAFGVNPESLIINACSTVKGAYNDKCKDINGTCGAGSMSVGETLEYIAWQSMPDKDVPAPPKTTPYVTDLLAAFNYVHSDAYTPLPASECQWDYATVCIPRSHTGSTRGVSSMAVGQFWFKWDEYGEAPSDNPAGYPEMTRRMFATIGYAFDPSSKKVVVEAGFFGWPGFSDTLQTIPVHHVYTIVDKMFSRDGSVVSDPGCNTTFFDYGPESTFMAVWIYRHCATHTESPSYATHLSFYYLKAGYFELTYPLASQLGTTPEVMSALEYKRHTPSTKLYNQYYNQPAPFGSISSLLCDDCSMCTKKCRFTAQNNATMANFITQRETLFAYRR